jgi:hypothetical protein
LCPTCLLNLGFLTSAGDVNGAGDTTSIPLSLQTEAVWRMGCMGLGLAATVAGIYLTGRYVQPGWIDPARAPVSYTVGLSLTAAVG